jgi:hypothetical protein
MGLKKNFYWGGSAHATADRAYEGGRFGRILVSRLGDGKSQRRSCDSAKHHGESAHRLHGCTAAYPGDSVGDGQEKRGGARGCAETHANKVRGAARKKSGR